MAEVDGKIVMKAPDGRLYRVPKEQTATQARDLGWQIASDEEAAERVRAREEYGRYSTAGQQALAATEQAIRTASFGLLPGSGDPEGIASRESILREHSPVISFGAQTAGAIAPALATGGALSGIAGAAGLGARGAAAVSVVGEGLAGGFADELEQARFEARDVSPGNVMLFGLGGEVIGRALPKALSMGAGRIRRALTAVDEASGEGVADALAATEARSVSSQARSVRDMPKGSPERAEALVRTAPDQYDRMAVETADDLDAITRMAQQMGDTSSSRRVVDRLRETIADPSPAQVEFFTATKQSMAAAKKAVRAPIDGPAPEASLDELLATYPTREAREEAAESIRESIADRLEEYGVKNAAEGSPDWATVEREIVTERVNALRPKGDAQSLASGDRVGFAKRFDAIIDGGLRRLDKTDDAVESYLITRAVKKELQQLSKKMSLVKAPQDSVLHEEMRQIVDGTWRGMKNGLADKSLFGNAAEIEAEINAAWHDKILRGIGISEQDLARRVDVDFDTGRLIVEYDPDKARSFYQKDAVGRTIGQRKLVQLLEGAEEMAAAHQRHGTWDTGQIADLRQRVQRVRQSLDLADEIQVAKREAKEAKASQPSGEKASAADTFKSEVIEFGLEKIVGSAVPFAGQLIKFARRLVSLDRAGRQATKQSARNLAGVGAEAAARRTATEVPTSPAAQRIRDAAARRQAESGYVDVTAKEKNLATYFYGATSREGITDFSKVAPDELRSIQEILPPGMSEEQFRRVMGVDHFGHDITTYVEYDENTGKVLGLRVTNHFGTPDDPGRMTRIFLRNKNTREVVHHAFFIPENARGIGRQIINDAFDIYSKAGIARVRIDSAVEVGRYLWPKMGFRPSAAAEKEAIAKFTEWAKARGNSVPKLKTLPDVAKADGGKEWLLSHDGPWNEGLTVKMKPGAQDGWTALGEDIDAAGRLVASSPRGPGVRDILLSPIGLTSAAGVTALAAPVAYNQITTSSIGDDKQIALRPAPASSWQRFTGDYSGPEESFEAKRQLLDAELTQPELLYELLGNVLDDLPKVTPELFQAIAARVAQSLRYLRENMPAGLQATLLYPNGTPPSRSALRDWAVMWNTVMDPESVLEDINAGTATPLQMKTLREAHQDIYEQLRADMIEQVGANFRDVPTATKLQLDLLFQADGLAGPMFSSSAARMIGDAMRSQAERKPSANRLPPQTSGESAASVGPAGIENIKSSVTNAGAS